MSIINVTIENEKNKISLKMITKKFTALKFSQKLRARRSHHNLI